MISILLLIALSVCISADDYDYGYNKYNHGFNKEHHYVPQVHIKPYYYPKAYPKPSLWPNYGHNYGYGYGHQMPYHTKRFVVVKQLPPIYKDVKQPVYVRQPVIIRKIPVIHKKKEVTVEKLPPIYDYQKPTVVEKDVGIDVTKHEVYEPKVVSKHIPMFGKRPVYGGGPKVDYEDKKIMMGEMPEEKVDMDEKTETGFEGMDGLNGMVDIEGMKGMRDVKDMMGKDDKDDEEDVA